MIRATLAGMLSRVTATGAVLGLTLAAAAALLVTPRGAAPARRMAISVTCETRCAEVEALADDVWLRTEGTLDVVVRADRLAELGMPYTVISSDIDADAAAEMARIRAGAVQSADWFAEYKEYGAITEKLQSLVAAAPDRTHLRVIGYSIEGRPIYALRIGAASATERPLLVDGTLHAREWIASMTSTCIADRLVTEYDTNAAVRALLDRMPVWVVPVANPDGYQHAWSANRYWRKNRRGSGGVDLNRNFGVGWGGRGSSASKSSDIYRGESAFSEPETRALRDLALTEQVARHIDFHSYGQIVLYPWGFTTKDAPDAAKLAAVGDRVTSALVSAHGTRYDLKPAAAFYPASGIMTDWMYGEAKAVSYTVELRPRGAKGLGGFVLPPEQIRPTCDEAFAAVLALAASPAL